MTPWSVNEGDRTETIDEVINKMRTTKVEKKGEGKKWVRVGGEIR